MDKQVLEMLDEFSDIASNEKIIQYLKEQILYNQCIRIEPLTLEEINIINSPEFQIDKSKLTLAKYK